MIVKHLLQASWFLKGAESAEVWIEVWSLHVALVK